MLAGGSFAWQLKSCVYVHTQVCAYIIYTYICKYAYRIYAYIGKHIICTSKYV